MEANITTEIDFRAWAASQIGKPYKVGADGPDKFDCWGLVKAAYALRGFPVPDYSNFPIGSVTRSARAMARAAAEWERIEEPTEGCLVALSKTRTYFHVGFWVDGSPGYCVHAQHETGVIGQTIRGLRNSGFATIDFYRPLKYG